MGGVGDCNLQSPRGLILNSVLSTGIWTKPSFSYSDIVTISYKSHENDMISYENGWQHGVLILDTDMEVWW